MAEVIRKAIDLKLQGSQRGKKLRIVEEMGGIDAPISDWEEMEQEIEEGFLNG
ncbi:MAG: hypothetical protein ACUVXI_19235 [bacterium]